MSQNTAEQPDAVPGGIQDARADSSDPGGGGAGGSEPPIPTGTRFCDIDAECFGLLCRSKGQSRQAACVAPCGQEQRCGSDELCIAARGLEPSCFASCGVLDCRSGFDCFDANRDGRYACVPAQWVPTWDE